MATGNSIAKNAMFLYFRMFLILAVTLYTSRIVLEKLGVSDFGIFSLVGGIVSMLSFFRGAMANATRRYLSFDIGLGDFKRLKKTFSSTLTIHFIIALVVFIIAETVGLWYLTNKMVFPSDRLFAVQVIYQFSVFTFLINIIQVPYDALIQAREKMDIYAFVSILEVVLKLVSVYLLIFIGNDKLITFAILTFCVALIIRLVSLMYCRKKFEESKYFFEFDRAYFKELISYSGWNMFGSLAVVAKNQGSNVILNLFFGSIINAAYGITTQVQTAVLLFVNNFQIAMNPQIIKTYAKGEMNENRSLISQGAKLSYFLLFIIICPIWINISFILKIWLINVPDYTEIFVKVALITTLIDTISGPLMIGAQATGKIKLYQIVVGFLLFLNLPISYILLKYYQSSPVIVFQVMIVLSLVTLFFRILFLKFMLQLNVVKFIYDVFFPILVVSTISIYLIYLLSPVLLFNESYWHLIINFIVVILLLILIVFFLGLNRNEKHFVKKFLTNKIVKKIKNIFR